MRKRFWDTLIKNENKTALGSYNFLVDELLQLNNEDKF